MSMSSVLLVDDRVYTDLVAVEIAEDLFPFVAEPAESLVVLLKELLIELFGFLRVSELAVLFV